MANRDLADLLRMLEAKTAHHVEVRVVRNALAVGADTSGVFEARLESGPGMNISRTEYGVLLAAGALHAPHPVPPDPDAVAPVFNCQECGEPMHRPQKVHVAAQSPQLSGTRDAASATAILFYCAKCHAELFGDLEHD